MRAFYELIFITDRESHLCLLVHCIDGRNLRNAKAQAVLARLAATPNIHVIATMDRVDLPLREFYYDIRYF